MKGHQTACVKRLVGYGRRPRALNGPTGAVAGNVLARAFKAAAPNQSFRGHRDITYIRNPTRDFSIWPSCWDLFSRQIVELGDGGSTPHTDLVLQALLAAVWRRKPKAGLLLHSDQGCQFTSQDWQSFLKAHGIVCSMSRRGNCHDNAAMESFFQLSQTRADQARKIYKHAR